MTEKKMIICADETCYHCYECYEYTAEEIAEILYDANNEYLIQGEPDRSDRIPAWKDTVQSDRGRFYQMAEAIVNL